MIREILEQQGVLVIEETEQPEKYAVTILNGEYIGLGTTFEEAKEQACRQYVRENGFKLEWFSDVVIHHYRKWNKKGGFTTPLQYVLGTIILNDDDDEKLIVWLYANDINIID